MCVNHFFRRSTARLMPIATDVTLFLTAESADERLDAETDRSSSLDSRNPPLSRTDCQRDWINEFSSSVLNRTVTWRSLFTRIRKPSLQAKRAFISSMRTSNENESAAKWGLTRWVQSVSSPLAMQMFISWQFRHIAFSQSMYWWLFTKSST